MDRNKKKLIEIIKKDESPIETCLLITNEYTTGCGDNADILALISQALIHLIENNEELDISIIDEIKKIVERTINKNEDSIENLLEKLMDKLGE